MKFEPPVNRAMHEAGLKRLYNGLSSAGIKLRKGISLKETLMSRMNATERAANLFLTTQACDKVTREDFRTLQETKLVWEQTGRKVRDAIQRLGGELPENIPPLKRSQQHSDGQIQISYCS
jgi:DNA-damage-inducible protein D